MSIDTFSTDALFSTRYLDGPAGAGKTTRAVAHLRALLDAGVAPESILLLTPQRSYTRAYEPAFHPAEWYRLEKATIGGLARRYVELFWADVAAEGGFSLDQPPLFLTYEQAQYYMSAVVKQLREERAAFPDLRLTWPRLYSQLLDNLNKVAAHGLDFERLPAYLDDVAIGEQGRGDLSGDIMEALQRYRAYCRHHSLVDFADELTLFAGMAGQPSAMRQRLLGQIRHLVADNLEEDVPAAHRLIQNWLPDLESALLIVDTQASYRLFMGASGASAARLAAHCAERETASVVHTTPAPLQVFEEALASAIHPGNPPVSPRHEEKAVAVYVDRLHHAMVERAAACVGRLVDEGIPPGEIAVIAPVLGDNVHTALTIELERRGLNTFAHRPSRLLHDEPVTRVMLTLATLAHPGWGVLPHREAVALLFYRLLGGCDLVRASLLAGAVVPNAAEGVALLPFESVDAGLQARITYRMGEVYERLRSWVVDYAAGPPAPIDHFFSRAFGELLSQSGFGFYREASADWQAGAIDAGKQVGALVESAARFRQAASTLDTLQAGKAYRDMVLEGVISAFYAFEWEEPADAVLLAPVHTFLLRNRPVRAQLWLDVGNPSWHRRINQPLTNPYILHSEWKLGQMRWDDTREHHYELERLAHAVRGLLRRCTGEAHLFVSALSPTGRDQKGLLLQALSRASSHAAIHD